MEDGELDWYSLDTSEKADELIEASTEVSSNLNISMDEEDADFMMGPALRSRATGSSSSYRADST